jgi:uncharacterized membrane protein (UPF0127 family)
MSDLDKRFDGLETRRLQDGLTLIVASTWRSRQRGLGKLGGLPPDHGLLITPCRSIHTVPMRFSLDLVWLDADGRPVRLDEDVGRFKARMCMRARSVVETTAGDGARFRDALAS